MSVYTNEDRFSMTAERYLAKHHVLTYMEDSIAQLLENREENPKLNPIKILSEYFTALRDGNHTMFREYQFIHMTPHNRASFVKLFWKCYKQIGKKGDLLSIQEYHSLITLLCSDFPFEIVQKTARIILMDDALDCLISFTDFIYAFQTQFYYEEFLDKCLEIYQSMIQTHSSPRNPVVVPSGTEDTKIHMNNHLPGDGVDAMQYFRAVYPLCDRMNYSTPPAEALKEILFNVPRVSFYGFLMAIAKSDAINEHIGRLPVKSELLEGADTEITQTVPIKTKADSAPLDMNNSNPVVMVTKTSVPQSQPRSRSVSRSRVSSRGQGQQNQLTVAKPSKKKVISSEESSDDTDDSDDDTDDDE
ncbi:centriolar satellite-associated tubulin polyglutamylase complex regulator 1-like isoform X2 [Ruditapes philippinarum]|uniref:centriolar satellite-associated tubulin polyglutamylase complex regulator 1-like isoform X2 n=1 Tax=Ruditapes philippinarum TaxID=129788 RepID=UPI00295C2225|nr:centriolar satellite-associated tubulin polyglutamylase complex regulator 1-like isoform X2 [Ruditapes philippinarum]